MDRNGSTELQNHCSTHWGGLLNLWDECERWNYCLKREDLRRFGAKTKCSALWNPGLCWIRINLCTALSYFSITQKPHLLWMLFLQFPQMTLMTAKYHIKSHTQPSPGWWLDNLCWDYLSTCLFFIPSSSGMRKYSHTQFFNHCIIPASEKCNHNKVVMWEIRKLNTKLKIL